MNYVLPKKRIAVISALLLASTLFRTVALAAPNDAVVRVMDENEKTVYLTFDDGPDSVNTLSVMETLIKYDAQATFFFVGRHMKSNPSVVKQVYDNGFSIGNHTYNHKTLTKLSAAGIKDELESFNNLLETITGERTAIMRPPGGALNDSVKKIIGSLGYKTYLWTIDPKDWASGKTGADVISNIKQNLKPGAVILLHSAGNQKNAAQILPELIEYIRNEGYEMKALPDPGYKTLPARRSTGKILLNGKTMNIDSYIIDGGIHVKIRDFASIVNGTQKQFGVSWNEKAKQINIITDSFYPEAPSVNAGDPEVRRAARAQVAVMIDGRPANISVYSINGSNYFNLHELARCLKIDFSQDTEANVLKFTIPEIKIPAFL